MTPFNSSYVSGTGVSGSYIVDTYNLGSMKFMGVAGLVTEDKVELPPTIDGILGLWYYPRIGDATILNVLKNSTALTQPIMGIWLQASTTVGVTSPGGEITIGGLNKDRYVGDITYVNCLPNRPWTIPMDEITVGSNVISTVGAMAAIDTGTTAMLVPQSYADLINGAIPGAVQALNLDNAWLLPCNGNVPITFTFGSFTAQVPYSTVAMQNRRYTSPQKPGVQLCKSSIMFPTGSVVSIEEWIIGATFLRTVYSVYDFGTNEASGGRIGFAFLSAGGGSKKPDSKDNANNNDGKNTGNNGTSGNKDDDADKPNSASRSLMSTTIAVQGAVLTVALLLALL
ncbi:hypothetical protein BGZ94_004650 [Podila epigama]|nr:hypothetical protein BGZ94_004650 [Podila epigama]